MDTEHPIELRATPSTRVAPHIPLTFNWFCARKHLTQQIVEAGAFLVPRCHQCMGKAGAPMQTGQIMSDSDGEVFIPLTPDESAKMQRSIIWGLFCRVLDHFRGKNGIGQVTDHWCIACEAESHMHEGQCRCLCHEAWQYRDGVEGSPTDLSAYA